MVIKKIKSWSRRDLQNFTSLTCTPAEKLILNEDLAAKAYSETHITEILLPRTYTHSAGFLVPYYEVLFEIIKTKPHLSK